jgi:hypothetical protein
MRTEHYLLIQVINPKILLMQTKLAYSFIHSAVKLPVLRVKNALKLNYRRESKKEI